MIECIFTIDYELYGNGEGRLNELVYDPTKRLMELFDSFNAKFVAFVEAAELEQIASANSDSAISDVQRQIRTLYDKGYEIALHLHPQWYNARYVNGKWNLDYNEYNLCTLSEERIDAIVDRSISYLRDTTGDNRFIPLSYRAGNWLLQPTKKAAKVLAGRGIKIDSSVFKGGFQLKHNLDYRPSRNNGYYWKFNDDVNVHQTNGRMIEIPIHTTMVPIWRIFSAKRIGLERKGNPSGATSIKDKLYRILERARFHHPMKLDFCRMTFEELTSMVDNVIREARDDPDQFRPIVAIGHTKELIDFDTIQRFLNYLRNRNIAVSTFRDIYPKVQ